MWNSVDSNKIVGMNMRVESYKSHLRNLKSMKSQVGIEAPWVPTFSLSKRKNKYYKFVNSKIDKQNEALLQRMIQIESEPMTKTIMSNISHVPSNKSIYLQTKERQRKTSKNMLCRQNEKMLEKITFAESDYRKDLWGQCWKQTMKYKKNILKKEHVADFLNLIKEEKKSWVRNKSRPQTANVHC